MEGSFAISALLNSIGRVAVFVGIGPQMHVKTRERIRRAVLISEPKMTPQKALLGV
jgi:hypothetical protein